MKICILGNSVGLRMRPPRANRTEVTYAEALERSGHCVRNFSRAGVMLNEVFRGLEEEAIAFFPDAVILHFGIVEISRRRTFRRPNNQAIHNYYMNRILDLPYRFHTPVQVARRFAWRAVNSATRRLAGLCGISWPWLPIDRFLEVLGATVQVLLKETGASVVVIGITPCSDRIEKHLRGTREDVNAANDRLQALCRHHGPRVAFLDPRLFIDDGNVELLVPDGIHFSAAGHRMVHQEIERILRRFDRQEAGAHPSAACDRPASATGLAAGPAGGGGTAP